MPYVTVPKDLTKVSPKVMLGLTKRQLICFGIAAGIGFPLFFLLRGPLGVSTAATVMVFSMMPVLFFAFYSHNDQPLEVYLRNLIRVTLLRPKARPYRTNNYYMALMRQQALYKEVNAIVQTVPAKKDAPKASRKAEKKRASGNSVRH